MDIIKFNKELKAKVAMAKGCEKRNEVDSALKLWLEISEMTLNFSKSRNIDVNYKNMLINRTKNIIEHIKNLKSGHIEKELFEEDVYVQEEIQEKLSTKTVKKEEPGSQEIDTAIESDNIEDFNLIESELKNLPEGFKEVQSSKDFTIITPHDKDYVKKRFNEQTDSHIFKQYKKATPDQNQEPREDRINFEQPNNSKNLICFACGYDKNPKNAKICKSCGTLLG